MGVSPAGGRELSRHGRGTEVIRPRARDERTGFACAEDAPPILFSLSCERKENAPCTVEEKRETLRVPSGVFSIHRWYGGQRCVDARPLASTPALRAYPGTGGGGRLPAANELSSPDGTGHARSAGREESPYVHAAGLLRSPDEWGALPQGKALSFVFGPYTARFYFLWQDRENRNGGCIPSTGKARAFVPAPWAGNSRPAPVARNSPPLPPWRETLRLCPGGRKYNQSTSNKEEL